MTSEDQDQAPDRISNPDTTCLCCHQPIRWVEYWAGGNSGTGEFGYVDQWGREGCPNPQQPDDGPFPHVPAAGDGYQESAR